MHVPSSQPSNKLEIFSLSDSLAALRLLSAESVSDIGNVKAVRATAILASVREKRVALENALKDYLLVTSEGTDIEAINKDVLAWLWKINESLDANKKSPPLDLDQYAIIHSKAVLDKVVHDALSNHHATADSDDECPSLESVEPIDECYCPGRPPNHNTHADALAPCLDSDTLNSLLASSGIGAGNLDTGASIVSALQGEIPAAVTGASLAAAQSSGGLVDPTTHFIYFRQVPPRETIPYYPSDDRPIAPSDNYHVVTRGRAIGVFSSWTIAQDLVIGVSRNCSEGKKSAYDACCLFWKALEEGKCEVKL